MPLRIFVCEQLEQWSQTELGSWVEDLLGRVPLFPCFLDGNTTSTIPNTTSTIPNKYTGRQKQAFKFGCADGQGPASRRGSHVYEINDWLWIFGRPQPRVGYHSITPSSEACEAEI